MNSSGPGFPGRLINDRYEPEVVLRSSGHANTFRARDLETNQFVVLEVLQTSLLVHAGDRAKIRREATVAGTIAHPNVSELLDFESGPTDLYLIYAYHPGRYLDELLSKPGALTEIGAVEIVREIALGLEALHGAGLVHGNLTLASVMFTWDEHVRIDGYLGNQPDSASVFGDANRYQPPETNDGRPAAYADDLFAAGVILDDLLGVASEGSETRWGGEFEHRLLRLTPALQEVLYTATNDAPRLRFQNAWSMRTALDSVLAGLRYTAPLTSAPMQMQRHAYVGWSPANDDSAVSVPMTTRTHVTPPSIPRIQRRTWLSLLCASAVILIFVITVVSQIRSIGNSDSDIPRSTPARAVVAGVSDGPDEENQTATAEAALEPEIVDQPNERSREHELEIAKAILTGSEVEKSAPAPAAVLATAEPEPDAASVPGPTSTPTSPRTTAITLAFNPTEWEGGWLRSDDGFLGRPWFSLYGAQSGFGEARLTFSSFRSTGQEAVLTLVGVDDQTGFSSSLRIEINGQEVFSGPSPFPSWDGESGTGPWTAISFVIPPDTLVIGSNEIVIANLNPADNFGKPPFILISESFLEIQ